MRFLAVIFVSASLFAADNADSVRKEIEATYQRALQAQREAKRVEDLDLMARNIDTPDWISIVDDGQPQHWQDIRPTLIVLLGQPVPAIGIRILKFTLAGEKAIVIARVGALARVNASDPTNTRLVRDTWVKTDAGWRRKLHEKPPAGKLESELN